MSRVAAFASGLLAMIAPSLAFDLTYDAHTYRQGWLQRDRELSERVLKSVEEEHARAPTLERTLSLAQIRVWQNRGQEAVDLLLPFTKRVHRPDLLATLVFAFEHLGRDQDALEWAKDLERFRWQDAYASEWLHVRILEAKLAMANDPSWFATHTLIGADFGDAAVPVIPDLRYLDHGRRFGWADLQQSLETQLYERKEFFATPDAIMADLHLAYADFVFAKGWNWENLDAARHYDCALEFGTPHRDRAVLRKAAYLVKYPPRADDKKKQVMDGTMGPSQACRRDLREPFDWRTLAGLIAALATIIGFLWFRRRNS